MRARHLLNLFGDRLRGLPILILYLTDGCNSRCISCDIWRSPRRNMPLDVVDAVVAACADLGVRDVLLSGGEATQHPRWPEIACRIRAQRARVMLSTNGLLLAKQAAQVRDSVDEVFVSLDGGTAATYQAIRGVDAFDRVLAGIRAVADLGVPVTTRATIQRANFHEMPQIITAARDAGAAHISFLAVDVSSPEAFGPRFMADPDLVVGAAQAQPVSPLMLRAEDLAAFREMLADVSRRFAEDFASGLIVESPSKLARLADYFGALLGLNPFMPPRCNAPHISAVVEVDGTLRPCYFLPAWGQLDGRPLAEALNDPAARTFRKAYREGRRPECARCVCPLYKGPRALLQR